MKYLLSYMAMFIAMIITLLLGGGFTTVLGISMLTLIFSTFFWEKWLEITKKDWNLRQQVTVEDF